MKNPTSHCACGQRHLGLVALIVALVAIALTATGTAVAVTATTVQIADPTQPSRLARVDAQGHLQTVADAATIATTGVLQTQYQYNPLTSPTNRTLAISRLTLTNPAANTSNSTSEVEVILRKVSVDSSGACVGAATNLAYYTLEPGDDIADTFPAPLIVGPTGSTRFCLSLYVFPTRSDGTINYFSYFSFSGYSTNGSYSGIGSPLAVTTPSTDRPTSR